MIKLCLVTETDDFQRKFVRELIEKYHSYVPTADSVGRRIDWLVYDVIDDTKWQPEEELIGMIGIGSGVYPPPKDILKHVGLTKEEYRKQFNSFANNWRFCLKKRVENGGTQILRQLRTLAPVEWKRKYGDDLRFIVTFVGAEKNGGVYLADNWKQIGETAGLPEHESSSMKWHDKEELKKKFVKPTGENKKLIFITRVGPKILPTKKQVVKQPKEDTEFFEV